MLNLDLLSMRDHQSLVVLDGLNVVKKCHHFCGKLEKIFIEKSRYKDQYEFFQNISKEPIEFFDSKEIEKIVGYRYHQGIIGVAKKPNFVNLDQLIGNLFILNAVVNAENVGSICRSLAAFNINSLIIDEKSCSPYLRRSIRVSMGNVFKLKIYQSQNLSQTIDELKKRNFNILAADCRSFSKALDKNLKTDQNAIIIGSEGSGIDESLYDKANHVIKIDTDSSVEFLNAGVSAAILGFWLKSN